MNVKGMAANCGENVTGKIACPLCEVSSSVTTGFRKNTSTTVKVHLLTLLLKILYSYNHH